MRNYHQDYFYMLAMGNNHPLLAYDKNTIVDSHLMFACRSLDENYITSFKFAYPIPKNPQLADVHNNAQQMVVSSKIKDILQRKNLKKVQFLPAEIRDPKTEDIYTDYHVFQTYNLIDCLDHNLSKYNMANGFVCSIEKLVLNNEILDKIPLEERLVFALWEDSTYVLYHQSVVEKILEIVPTGLTVYRLSGLPFIENYMKQLKGEE